MPVDIEPVAIDRPLMGFPDTWISIKMFGDHAYEVEITESGTPVRVWFSTDSQSARNYYYHPFAYGYEWRANGTSDPSDTSSSDRNSGGN